MASGTRSQVRARQEIQDRKDYVHKHPARVIRHIYTEHNKVKKTCQQIKLIKNLIKDNECRLGRALAVDCKERFAFLLKNKITVQEETYDKFAQFLLKKVETVENGMIELEEVTGIVYSTYLAEHQVIIQALEDDVSSDEQSEEEEMEIES